MAAPGEPSPPIPVPSASLGLPRSHFASTDPFQQLDPAQKVKVLPRHLAGPGPISPHTAWLFPFDKDWSLHQPEEKATFATSPCLRLWTSLVLEPDQPRKGTWTIAADRVPFGPASWQITLDATTPVELLHDLHTELLDLYLEDRHSDLDWLHKDEIAPHEAYAPLFARGWSHQVKTDGTQIFLAPDGLGGIRHRYAAIGPDNRPGGSGADTRANPTGRRASPPGRPPRSSRPSPPH